MFDEVAVDGGTLLVSLASGVSAGSIERYGPDGELAEKAMVPPSEDPAQFDLFGGPDGDVYSPGEHTLRAIAGGESIGETSVHLEPDVTLAELRWAKNHPEMDWDKNSGSWKRKAALLFENTGSGPALLSRTRWQDAPFVLRTDEDFQEFEPSTPIPPGETTTVVSTPAVYETRGGPFGAALRCGELGTETLELTAVLDPGPDATLSQTIEYGGERGNCTLQIVEGDG